MMGMAMHFVYTMTLTLYVNEVYLVPENPKQPLYTIFLGFGVLYPMWYELRQFKVIGWEDYLQDIGNYNDMLYIWGSFVNIFLQNTAGPRSLSSQIIMI